MQRRLIVITGVAGVAMLLLGGLAMGILLSSGPARRVVGDSTAGLSRLQGER